MKRIISIIIALLSTYGLFAQDSDWKELWEKEYSICFADGFNREAYINSPIVDALEQAIKRGEKDAEQYLLFWKLSSPECEEETLQQIINNLVRLSEEDNYPPALLSLGLSMLNNRLEVWLPYSDNQDGVYDDDVSMANPDMDKAISFLQNAAEKGEVVACRFLSRIYLGFEPYSDLTEPDFDKAYYYTKLGAEQGDAYCQFGLAAMFYYTGNSEYPQKYADEEKYQYWMRQAAENGFARAQYLIGRNSDTPEKKMYWFKKAASNGDEDAISLVAWTYNQMGEYQKMLQWYNEYINSYPHLFHLKECRIDALTGLGATDEALSALEELADCVLASPSSYDNDCNGRNYKGDLYNVAHRLDVAADKMTNKKKKQVFMSKSFRIYEISSEMGNIDSRYLLGLKYILGEGTRVNMKKGKETIADAARRGNPNAQEYCNSINMHY